MIPLPKCILIKNMIARRIEYKLLKTSEGHTLNVIHMRRRAIIHVLFGNRGITQIILLRWHLKSIILPYLYRNRYSKQSESYLATDANRRDHEAIMCIKTDDTVEKSPNKSAISANNIQLGLNMGIIVKFIYPRFVYIARKPA